ncbi:MAG: PKD domain-containing protein, partial [Bacteroidia bacterium]|nr:PKD domain-containing protein [Bacteroidia bacterium]
TDTKYEYSKTGTFTVRLIASSGSGCADTSTMKVKIQPGAKAVFTTNKDYACAPATFKFTNKSFYANEYFWYVNGTLASKSLNLSDTFLKSDSTVLSVKLKVTNTSGCQNDSVTHLVFTPKNPKAIITNNDEKGCGPLSVTFDNASTNATKYSWTLGNGLSTNLKNPNASYKPSNQKDTFYKTKLIAYNWVGCKDSTKSDIQVYPLPLAKFTQTTTNGCGPLNVSFTNLSHPKDTGNISMMSFYWTFSNGTSSVKTDPTADFIASKYNDSNYSVVLAAYSEHNCLAYQTTQVTVYPDPFVDFINKTQNGCAPLNVAFTNISDPGDTGSIRIMKFNWDLGNGKSSTLTNPSAIYLSNKVKDTVYNVRLAGESEHGCKDTSIRQVKVYPFPVAAFTVSDSAGCGPLLITTSNKSVPNDTGNINIMSFNWTISNGFKSSLRDISQELYSHPTKDTTYYVTLEAISEHGCKNVIKKPVIVHPKPVAAFSLPKYSGCSPMTLAAINTSTNATSYFWDNGNGFNQQQKQHTFAFPGLNLTDSLYTVQLFVKSAFGCVSDTVQRQALLIGRPLAAFSSDLDSVCAKEKIQISNNSLGGIKYLWDFGDGTKSNGINPAHKYTVKGSGAEQSFNVSLEVISKDGCRDTVRNPLHLINSPAEPIVSSNPAGCSDLKMDFSHNSTKFKTVIWDFADGFTSTDDKTEHTYVNATGISKTYKVTLIRKSLNCYDTSSRYVTVFPKVVASLDASRIDLCNKGEYKFTSLSQGSQKQNWKIDNAYASASNSFIQKLKPSIKADTVHTVMLSVSNSYGCVDTVKIQLTMKPEMVLNFVMPAKSVCEKDLVNFVNTSQNVVRYLWDFGDGGFSVEKTPKYNYSKPGVFAVKLKGFDKDGCVDSVSGNGLFAVKETPKPDFSYNSLLPKLPNAIVTFINTTKLLTYNIATYEWDFGDNTPVCKEENPKHEYKTAGNYRVTLKAFNGSCWSVIQRPIFIDYESPELHFDADVKAGCMPLKVNFDNQTKFGDTYRWIFGDGFESEEKSPSHVFLFDGTFSITLIVTGPGGITTFVQKSMITVYPKPYADFITDKRSQNLPNITFNMRNVSENAGRFEWQFTDSTGSELFASTKENPVFTTNKAGNINVRLVAMNDFFCRDTAYEAAYLQVNSPGTVYVPNVFTPNKDGKNENFVPVYNGVTTDNFLFRIFNRWGEKIFETTNQQDAWNGIYKDNVCEQDVYVWTVTGQFVNGDVFEKKGTVTLLH